MVTKNLPLSPRGLHFDVLLDGGKSQERYHLNRSYYGLYVPPMVWRELDNFSSGSVCLCLVSDYFDEENYIRKCEDLDFTKLIVAMGKSLHFPDVARMGKKGSLIWVFLHRVRETHKSDPRTRIIVTIAFRKCSIDANLNPRPCCPL